MAGKREDASKDRFLVLYLERPLHNRSEVHDQGRALQIQRLEGSRPADVYGI
jgi:hypothetical protein